MRSLVIKIVDILIIFIAVFAVIACNKMNSDPADQPDESSAYTVVFKSQFPNDGNLTTMPYPITKQVIPPATTIDALPTDPSIKDPVTKEEKYKFGGWYTGANASGIKFTESTTVGSDLFIYAFWYKYLVTFYKNSTTVYAYKGTTPSSPNYIDELPTPPTDIAKFAGWNTKSDGTGNMFYATTKVTADINLYAMTSNADTVYTVTYDSQGGTSVGAQYVKSGDAVGALPPDPVNPCYVFNNWWTLKSGGVQFTAATAITSNTIVYAHWSTTPRYKVTFNSGWGTSVDAKCVNASNTLDEMPEDPSKHGYLFKGWYTEKNGGGSVFNESSSIAANITVYADWEFNAANCTPKSTYAIGDPGPSCIGKVFYIGNGGQKGLEMAPPGWSDPYSSDADPLLTWISGDYYTDENGDLIERTQITFNGNTSTAIGTGKANSDAIIYQTQNPVTSSAGSAAQKCTEYQGGGFNDWFLPSKDELAQLYLHRDEGWWGGFLEAYYEGYWSSSEYDQWNAWSQDFINGTQQGTSKSYSRRFRPVRSFDLTAP